MDQSLLFFRETLSNYLEKHEIAQDIYERLAAKNYSTEKEFVDMLSQKEIGYLSDILPDEIEYAKNEQDDMRYSELNEVYEQLY